MFQGQISKYSSISRIFGLIDVKWKGSELIWYWADCMTLPFDHTHDLDLGVSRSESEIALSQEWGGRLTRNKKELSDGLLKIARCQFSDVKLGRQVTEAVELFNYKMYSFTQITFHLENKWSKSAIFWFSYITWHKWYLKKMIYKKISAKNRQKVGYLLPALGYDQIRISA